MAVAIIIGAQVSSRVLTKLGVRPLLLVGTMLACGGSTWLAEASSTTEDLFSVDVGGYCGVAPFGFCAYAAGSVGTLLSYGTSSWGPSASGTTEDLYGFSYLGPYFTEYAAVGANNTEITGVPLGA